MIKTQDNTDRFEKLRNARLPRHIAVIMDGNGRWAQKRGLTRAEGHRAGAKTIDMLVETLLKLEIPYVSLYAFSTENWKRPKIEVGSLFSLLNEFIGKKVDTMVEKKIQMRVSGDLSRIPKLSQKLVREALEKTKGGDRLIVNFCINYGSRDEILKAVNELIREQKEAKTFHEVTFDEFEKKLYTVSMPEVDLMIRTAGEKRLSNFLLYQAAYAEFYFTSKYWPDFDEEELFLSLNEFQGRVRKFGGLDKKFLQGYEYE